MVKVDDIFVVTLKLHETKEGNRLDTVQINDPGYRDDNLGFRCARGAKMWVCRLFFLSDRLNCNAST